MPTRSPDTAIAAGAATRFAVLSQNQGVGWGENPRYSSYARDLPKCHGMRRAWRRCEIDSERKRQQQVALLSLSGLATFGCRVTTPCAHSARDIRRPHYLSGTQMRSEYSGLRLPGAAFKRRPRRDSDLVLSLATRYLV